MFCVLCDGHVIAWQQPIGLLDMVLRFVLSLWLGSLNSSLCSLVYVCVLNKQRQRRKMIGNSGEKNNNTKSQDSDVRMDYKIRHKLFKLILVVVVLVVVVLLK